VDEPKEVLKVEVLVSFLDNFIFVHYSNPLDLISLSSSIVPLP
jgi:hypothetical protein